MQITHLINEGHGDMCIAFNSLLPGETLYNNFSRYAEEMGIRRLYYIYKTVLDRHQSSVGNLYRPSFSFQKLAEETEICWGLSASDILLEHTFFRYDTQFLQPNERERWFQSAICFKRLPDNRVLSSPVYPRRSSLRYCERCIEEAKQSGFSGYFMLMHQLPGVLICPVHETLLYMLPIEVGNLDHRLPCSYGQVDRTNPTVILPIVDSLNFPGILDVARRSYAVLRGNGECMKNFPYCALLEEGGLKHKEGSLKVRELKDALLNYYGKELCMRSGIASPDFWKIVSSGDWTTVPFRHILMQSFLSFRVSGKGDFRPRISTIRPKLQRTECPGALHLASDKFLDARLTDKGVFYHVTCSCTLNLWVQCDSEGKVMRMKIKSYGKRYRDKFAELVESGLSETKAARNLNIVGTAWMHWAECNKNYKALSRAEISLLRRKWTACVESLPESNRITSAMKQNGALYARLLRYDHDWLKDFNRCHRDHGHGGRIASKWLAKMTAAWTRAHANLRALEEPVWISRKNLADASGVGSGDAHCSPEINAIQSQLCESREDFQKRAFKYWLSRLTNDRPLTLARFGYITGLKKLSMEQKKKFFAWSHARSH